MYITKSFLWVLLLLAILVGCEKDEEKTKEQKEQTVLDVPKVHFGNRGIVIEWKTLDNSGSHYYELIMTTDNKTFTTIYGNFGIRDGNQMTYTHIDYPFVDTIYYQIAAYGNERIESQKVGLAIPDPMQLDFNPVAGYMMPDREEILFLKNNQEGPGFNVFDYKSGKIRKNLNLEGLIRTYGFGKFEGNYEFYFSDILNPRMHIYDAVNFEYKASFDFEEKFPTHVSSDLSNFIYRHDYNNIQIVNRNTLISKYYKSVPKYDLLELYYMEGLNKLIGFTFDREISIFNLGDSGTIVNESHKKIGDPVSIGYIQGTKYIYANCLDGLKIINTDNWEEKTLLNANHETFYSDLLYAKNGVLYVNFENLIYCYSLNNLELIEYFPTRIEPYMLLSDNKYLILIGTTVKKWAIIDTMKLSKLTRLDL